MSTHRLVLRIHLSAAVNSYFFLHSFCCSSLSRVLIVGASAGSTGNCMDAGSLSFSPSKEVMHALLASVESPLAVLGILMISEFSGRAGSSTVNLCSACDAGSSWASLSSAASSEGRSSPAFPNVDPLPITSVLLVRFLLWSLAQRQSTPEKPQPCIQLLCLHPSLAGMLRGFEI